MSVVELPALARTLAAGREEQIAERPRLSGRIGNEPEWVVAEREFLRARVNAARADKGKPAVDIARIREAESRALGHSDYVAKFAIGCAELIIAD